MFIAGGYRKIILERFDRAIECSILDFSYKLPFISERK